VDLYAGTSTGAIIGGALMLQDKKRNYLYSIDRIKSLYLKRGQQIFNKDLVKNQPKEHAIAPLQLVLENNFGGFNIASIRKHFLFLSYDLVSDSSFVFMDKMERFRDIPLSKIMMACTAVPGLFTPVKIGNFELIDGILAAKNPSFLAYEYLKLYYPNDPIILLSLGTGKLSSEHQDIIEEEMERVDDQLNKLAKTDPNLIYYRLQPDLKEASSEMDNTDPQNIQALQNDALNFIDENTAMFEELFNMIEIKVR
jgi:predicted acylesterase/phospholipase RssA